MYLTWRVSNWYWSWSKIPPIRSSSDSKFWTEASKIFGQNTKIGQRQYNKNDIFAWNEAENELIICMCSYLLKKSDEKKKLDNRFLVKGYLLSKSLSTLQSGLSSLPKACSFLVPRWRPSVWRLSDFLLLYCKIIFKTQHTFLVVLKTVLSQ